MRKIQTNNGIVPMNADVLMIGVDPEQFDSYQRGVKGSFQSMHMGWMYVANLGKTFEDVFAFLPKRLDLDVIYVDNDVKRSKEELLVGAGRIVSLLQSLDYAMQPWVILSPDVDFLYPMFESAGITVMVTNIEYGCSERHRQKCQLAEHQGKDQDAA